MMTAFGDFHSIDMPLSTQHALTIRPLPWADVEA
jgi:hypothetical protein